MGHERCGGIAAALTGQFHDAPAGEGGFVHRWMEPDRRAGERALPSAMAPVRMRQRLLEEVAIRQSLANLRTFPFVAERETAGTLAILGCHFSIRDGAIIRARRGGRCLPPRLNRLG